MKHESTMSEYVQDYINTLEWESDRDVLPENRAENQRARKTIEVIVDDIISSRETLTDNKLAGIEKLVIAAPELVNDFLDERFTRDLIDAVSGYVRRTMRLSRLEGSRTPSQVTNGYLREAVRTYVMGLPQASVALSRAALEQALKENLGYQGTGTFVEMNNLLEEAEGAQVIDKTIRRLARRIADEADDVLHERPTSLDKAYDVLVMLRGVLQHVYNDD
jgi:Domain of unknown function (DUF4145)